MSSDRAAIDQLLQASKPGAIHVVLHYLYFPEKTAAAEAARELRRLSFGTEERLGADGTNWLVLARHEIVPSEEVLATTRAIMQALVEHRGGEYDGWEAEVAT